MPLESFADEARYIGPSERWFNNDRREKALLLRW